jgi:ADP-heptose:LPS heptosyltransferase
VSTGCVALRAAGIGDLLTAVPALRALGQVELARPLRVAAPAWLADLVALVPGVAGLVGTTGLQPQGSDRPRIAVNLHGCGPASHEALISTGPRRLWAYRCPGTWEDGPGWDEEGTERERWCRLVTWYGVEADPAAVGLDVPDPPPPVRDAAVVHVGGKDADRRWDGPAAAALAAHLRQAGERVVITGGPDDRQRAGRVAAAAGLREDAVLAGRLGLRDLAALVAASRLVVSADTGAAHLATAYAVPSVVVFGPADPQRWGPPASPRHRVLRAPGPRPRAADVGLHEVRAAVQDLLAEEMAA